MTFLTHSLRPVERRRWGSGWVFSRRLPHENHGSPTLYDVFLLSCEEEVGPARQLEVLGSLRRRRCSDCRELFASAFSQTTECLKAI